MKYITSCPQCDTHFLVNDELIQAYAGKARCGNCQHVFNTSNRLTQIQDEITSADEYQASLSRKELEYNAFVKRERESQKERAAVSVNETVVSKPTAAVLPGADKINFSLDKTGPKKNQTAEQKDTPDVTLNLDRVKKARKKPSKHAWLWTLISLILLLALILQATYFFRGRIAAEYPQTKLVLEHICKKLKCTIELPKNLDLISISDSDMQEDDAYEGVINFSTILKNYAKYPQAYPNIELTLTDEKDIVIIKKLVTPSEYLAAKEKVKQGLAPHQTANIKIVLRIEDASVANYRLLLLY